MIIKQLTSHLPSLLWSEMYSQLLKLSNQSLPENSLTELIAFRFYLLQVQFSANNVN